MYCNTCNSSTRCGVARVRAEQYRTEDGSRLGHTRLLCASAAAAQPKRNRNNAFLLPHDHSSDISDYKRSNFFFHLLFISFRLFSSLDHKTRERVRARVSTCHSRTVESVYDLRGLQRRCVFVERKEGVAATVVPPAPL